MISTIDALTDKDVGSGASAAMVQEVERILGVHFPNDYAAFLLNYGWARLYYDELYGVGKSAPPHLSLITNTERERKELRPYIPKHLVPVLPDGAGNHYCLDLSKADSETCPIVFWDHDAGESQTPETVDLSFSEWLVNRISDNT